MRPLTPVILAALLFLPAAGLTGEPGVVIIDAETKGGAKVGSVLKTLKSNLSDLAVPVFVEETAKLPPAFADQVALARQAARRHSAGKVLWLNPAQDQVFMYVAEPGGDRVLVRTVEAKNDAERAEAIAIIARNFVSARLDLAAPVSPSAPHGAPQERLHLRWGYAAEFFGPESPSPNGLFSALSFDLSEQWSIHAGGRLMERAEASRGGVAVGVRRYPVEAGVGWAKRLGVWRLGVEAGGVLEVLAGEPEGPAGANGARYVWGGRAAFVGGREIGRSSELFMELGALVFFDTAVYPADLPAGSDPVLSSWRVRPMVKLGLDLGIF
ncbi:MAG: hypothetical protein HY897_05565 [Deltaproteobacteria bacterium]|nr:hypothetical protein [Deltaproteobacteria bacterium]